MILSCLWVWVLMRLRITPTRKNVLCYVLPVAAFQIALVPRAGFSGTVLQYLFWFTRDLGMACCLAFSAWYYRRRSSAIEKLDLDRTKFFFKVAVVLVACVFIEDTCMMLVLPPLLDMSNTNSFFWYLSERNISENVLLIAAAIQLFSQFSHIFKVYAQHPRSDAEIGHESDAAADDLISRIVIFSDARGLSKSEQEVLALILRGSDAQNIASELVISPGTVKAHMHRIYVKSGVSGKDDLIKEFWRS